MDTFDEKEILINLKAGNIEAFEKILFAYEKRIFNYIYRAVGVKMDAEDITQETFIKLYEHRTLINPDGNFKSWLYTIATNDTRDFFRKKGRRNELFIIDDPDEPEFETIDNFQSYSSIEAKNDVGEALMKIKPIYREVLLLFYEQGFAYQEIAQILFLPINTIKTYLRRAKEALKKELGENYG